MREKPILPIYVHSPSLKAHLSDFINPQVHQFNPNQEKTSAEREGRVESFLGIFPESNLYVTVCNLYAKYVTEDDCVYFVLSHLKRSTRKDSESGPHSIEQLSLI